MYRTVLAPEGYAQTQDPGRGARPSSSPLHLPHPRERPPRRSISRARPRPARRSASAPERGDSTRKGPRSPAGVGEGGGVGDPESGAKNGRTGRRGPLRANSPPRDPAPAGRADPPRRVVTTEFPGRGPSSTTPPRRSTRSGCAGGGVNGLPSPCRRELRTSSASFCGVRALYPRRRRSSRPVGEGLAEARNPPGAPPGGARDHGHRPERQRLITARVPDGEDPLGPGAGCSMRSPGSRRGSPALHDEPPARLDAALTQPPIAKTLPAP